MGFYERIRAKLLALPGVVEGVRFGGPAFFYGRRFFCHCHVGSTQLSLEAFVFDQADKVTKSISGVIPHPEYSAFGWVRLPIRNEDDLEHALQLVELTYGYLRTTRRISLPRNGHNLIVLRRFRNERRDTRLRIKKSAKRIQVQIRVDSYDSLDEAEELVEQEVGRIRKLAHGT